MSKFVIGKTYTSEIGDVYKVDDIRRGGDGKREQLLLRCVEGAPRHSGLRPVCVDEQRNQYANVGSHRRTDRIHA